MKQKSTSTSDTQKVRRRAAGGKPSQGHPLQKEERKIRRPNPSSTMIGKPDPTLTGVGGLLSFHLFTKRIGLGSTFQSLFGKLKIGKRVVYPMAAQMQLLIDAAICGASRVFGIESLALDPLFVRQVGGSVPCIDTIYDDLRRFEEEDLEEMEAIVAAHGLAGLNSSDFVELTMDVDTTVTPLYGEQEGAKLGPNPKHKGRPSYHPILASIAETRSVVGARLRHGNTGLGELEAEDLDTWIDRVRAKVGPNTIITVRIDSGGDVGELLELVASKRCHFLVKLKQHATLLGAVAAIAPGEWRVVDCDADGKETRAVAEVDFRRDCWPSETKDRYRVFAVRSSERISGRKTCLWDDNDASVSIYVTNDKGADADDLALKYDARAGMETVISALKTGFTIGAYPTKEFNANEAAFLLKVLAYNLMHRWHAEQHPKESRWSARWIREFFVQVPGRLLRVGGRWVLRLAPRHPLN